MVGFNIYNQNKFAYNKTLNPGCDDAYRYLCKKPDSSYLATR